jgi:hypothetical protein
MRGDERTGRGGRTPLLVAALCGAVTPILVAAFARDRFWHEGVLGFLVATVASLVLASAPERSWQRQTARVLLALAGLTIVVLFVLLALWIAAVDKHGFPAF